MPRLPDADFRALPKFKQRRYLVAIMRPAVTTPDFKWIHEQEEPELVSDAPKYHRRVSDAMLWRRKVNHMIDSAGLRDMYTHLAQQRDAKSSVTLISGEAADESEHFNTADEEAAVDHEEDISGETDGGQSTVQEREKKDHPVSGPDLTLAETIPEAVELTADYAKQVDRSDEDDSQQWTWEPAHLRRHQQPALVSANETKHKAAAAIGDSETPRTPANFRKKPRTSQKTAAQGFSAESDRVDDALQSAQKEQLASQARADRLSSPLSQPPPSLNQSVIEGDGSLPVHSQFHSERPHQFGYINNPRPLSSLSTPNVPAEIDISSSQKRLPHSPYKSPAVKRQRLTRATTSQHNTANAKRREASKQQDFGTTGMNSVDKSNSPAGKVSPSESSQAREVFLHAPADKGSGENPRTQGFMLHDSEDAVEQTDRSARTLSSGFSQPQEEIRLANSKHDNVSMTTERVTRARSSSPAKRVTSVSEIVEQDSLSNRPATQSTTQKRTTRSGGVNSISSSTERPIKGNGPSSAPDQKRPKASIYSQEDLRDSVGRPQLNSISSRGIGLSPPKKLGLGTGISKPQVSSGPSISKRNRKGKAEIRKGKTTPPRVVDGRTRRGQRGKSVDAGSEALSYPQEVELHPVPSTQPAKLGEKKSSKSKFGLYLSDYESSDTS